jgi:hypothetical protein
VRKASRVLACSAALVLVLSDAAFADPGSAAALDATYAVLKAGLGDNPFHRPLDLQSSETTDLVRGEANGLIKHPFVTATTALDKAGHWCDILTLHLNTKYCRPSVAGDKTTLRVNIGKKFNQPLAEAHRVDFVYRVGARTANYLRVTLDADEGPLGTRDYRIVLEAAPMEGGQTFIRLSYSYSYGVVAGLAMHAYLGTIGRDKVGFTVTGRESDGRPRYVAGMRGLVERNTMRYYLAIEAFLGSLALAPAARTEKSLRDWFAAIEAYPRQLHEMERLEYLDMKRREYSRQRAES